MAALASKPLFDERVVPAAAPDPPIPPPCCQPSESAERTLPLRRRRFNTRPVLEASPVHQRLLLPTAAPRACVAREGHPPRRPRGPCPADVGWRVAYLLTTALGLIVVTLRLFLPESPRWLVAAPPRPGRRGRGVAHLRK